MNAGELPLWVQWLAGLLLVVSGLLCVTGALGLVRLKYFFHRMHAPALAATLATWCIALASILCLSVLGAHLVLKPWVAVILLAITVPVSTVLLMRAGLFRARLGGKGADHLDGSGPPE